MDDLSKFLQSEKKITVIKEAKDLNTMSTESLINSLPSYELKLKPKTQDKENARMKKSIALKLHKRRMIYSL